MAHPEAPGRRDYYEVLGVPRDADDKTIKSAFRRLARRYHPDRSKEPDAGERFREIAEAYRVLSDPAKRADYDRSGFAAVTGMGPEDVWSGIDFGDLFGAGAGGFGEGLFERLFGRRARPGPLRGGDVATAVTLPLDRVLHGGRVAVTIPRPGTCPECSGSGARKGTAPRSCAACGGTGQLSATSRRGNVVVQEVTACPDCGGRGTVIDEPCPACGGTGQTVQRDRVMVRIDPGVPDGVTLRIPGRGMPAPAPGGEPGDAYVTVRSAPDPRFSRRGADLWHALEIPVPGAVLGTTVTVPSLEGDIEVRIPPGIQPGATLRVHGRGLPRYRARGRGDLNLAISVLLPVKLSPRERRLYEQLRDEHPRAGQEPHPAART